MAPDLPLETARRKARARGVLVAALETSLAALAAGRNVLIVDETVERGVALAEAIVGTACEVGICIGALTVTGNTLLLLTHADLVAERFVNDVWLIVRSADPQALSRIAAYSDRARLAGTGWRAMVVSADPLSAVIVQTDARTRRRFACVDMAAA